MRRLNVLLVPIAYRANRVITALRLAVGLVTVAVFAPISTLMGNETTMVAMSDGVRLSTDVYYPNGKGPWPVVLMRTPYFKAQGHFDEIAAPWIENGWVLVVQDTRGRGASEGANIAFDADGWVDHKDGADTLTWLAKQPWCDGRVATTGASALGIAQLLLAGTGGGPLSAQYIQVATPSLYEGVYRQGVFRKTLVEEWLETYAYNPATLQLWTEHSRYDSFWASRDLADRYQLVNAPAVHEGGWFDIFSQGTLNAFTGYNEQGGLGARGRQSLIMGPWTHVFPTDHVGQLIFPGAGSIPKTAATPLEWFNKAIGSANVNPGESPRVWFYTMGDTSDPKAPGNLWRASQKWPPSGFKQTSLYLHADLTASFAQPSTTDNPLCFSANPENPVPTLGGPQLPGTSVTAGPMDQKEIEARSDVLVFTSEPLLSPIEVTGRLTAKIWISSDAPDTDIFVRLCIVGSDGRSFNLAEGAIRARFWQSVGEENLLEPGKVYPLQVDLWSTSVVFNQGNKIRIQITSSSSPGFEVNPNNGLPLKAKGGLRIAHNKIYVSPDYPSKIILPIASFQSSPDTEIRK